jgi:hypothetical protein
MPNRFSSQAANADAMRENADASEGMSSEIGADGTPRDRSDHSSPPQKKGSDTKGGDAKAAESKDDQAKAGKDINSAGFVKDKDASKP